MKKPPQAEQSKSQSTEKDEGGRPTTLTPEVHRAIIENRSILGMPEGLAGEAAGIPPSTLSTWKARGKKAEEQWNSLTNKEKEKEAPFSTFSKALREARPKFIRTKMIQINKAAMTDWRAAARQLEWEDQENFGRHLRVGGDKNAPLEITILAERIKTARERANDGD